MVCTIGFPTSIQNEFDYHCNSFLFKTHKLLLVMESKKYCSYPSEYWYKFHVRSDRILSLIYDNQIDDDDEEGDDDEDDNDELQDEEGDDDEDDDDDEQEESSD